MENMEHKIVNYLRHHTLLTAGIVILVFIALASGEYYLYRNAAWLNKMLAEGLMQLKESKPKEYITISDQVIIKQGKTYVQKIISTQAINKEIIMSDGNKITPQGEIISKNGQKTKLKEGEIINLD